MDSVKWVRVNGLIGVPVKRILYIKGDYIGCLEWLLGRSNCQVEFKDGNLIHYRDPNGREYWKVWKDGNLVHFRDSSGREYWQEWENGNLVHYRNYSGEGERYSYIIGPDGILSEIVRSVNSD